jgi:acyl dehydratase
MTRFPVITEEALTGLRTRIGRPVPRPEPYIEVATRDAIRHWAHGIGDRNPFWVAGDVAPPTILFAMDRIVSGYVGGLPGIHAMYAGTDFRWRQPIHAGDRVVGESVLVDLVEKASTFARRAIQQTYRTVFSNQHGAVVCEADSWCFRTERDTARERAKYRSREPHRYTAAELTRIRRAYRDEELRGSQPRYWDDVRVGEALPEIVKGPLTVTSVIAFVQGWGSLYVRAHGLAFDLFERHPALGIPNAFDVPEPPERVHWDDAFARTVGVPGAYDYGPERVAWLGHLVTNWMGNAGSLRRLNVRVQRHNLIGDTTWCRGTVTAKGRAEGRPEVTLALTAVNQRDETIAAGEAVVGLPARGA